LSEWFLTTKNPITLETSNLVYARLLPWADVKAFGAKGDGSTDDSSAIIATINSGAAIILFPVGTYKITSNITFPSTVAVQVVDGAVLSPIEAFASFAGPIRATQMQQLFSGGQIWAVSQTGTVGSPQISVVSRAGPWTYALQVQITMTGSASTAKFKYSLDGGATWILNQQAAPTFSLTGTSLTRSFPGGTYNSGTNYEWILNQTASSPGGGPSITANPLALPALASFSDYTLQVQIVTPGLLGTAQFKYSINGVPGLQPSPHRARHIPSRR
jgi:hypothetical protein